MYLLGVIILFFNIQRNIAQIKWLSTPQDAVVILGEDLMLNCSASETNGFDIIYQWLYNDSSVSSKYSIFLNHSILIPKITSEDLGDYRCTVKTTNGSEISSPIATVIEAYIDKFLKKPKSARTIEGEIIIFECVTGKSAPPSDIYWELNGEPYLEGLQMNSSYGDSDTTRLSQQYSMKLELRAERNVAGTYRCVSVNNLLKKTVKSEDASLFVGYKSDKPTIVSDFKPDIIIADGDYVTIDCDYYGYPKPTVWWFHNGNLVDDTLQRYFYPNGSLAFNPIGLSDAGVYYCEVFNRMGRVRSNSTNITISTLGILFAEEPSDNAVFAGQSTTLKCIPPMSIPPATVTWYKDYKPVQLRSGEMSVSIVSQTEGIWDLYFSSVQRRDEGIYFCIASNMFSIPTSRTSRAATLSVQGAPTITEPPSDKRIVKGELLQLVCKVDAKPSATVKWLFQNLPLTVTPKITFRDGQQELNIGDIGKPNEGIYTCVANNSYGEKRSQADVQVIVPPVTVKMIGNIVYKLYQTAVIPCDIYGDPAPLVQWYKDAEILSNIQTNSANSLIINNVTTSDEGKYSCRGENEAGITWSNGTLKLNVPPRIIQGPEHTTVLIGQSTRLNCKVIGYPRPINTWLLNGTSITDSYPGGIVDNGEYLNINMVTWQHVGVYTCVATSTEGSDQHSALLHLNVPANVRKILGDNVILVQHEINLRCSSEGAPTPSIVWHHQGQIMHASSNGRVSFPSPFTIKIKFASSVDAGVVTCKASNDIGSSQKSIELFIIDSPKPPLLAGVYPVSKSSINLMWMKVEQRKYTNTTYYRIYYKQRLKENYKLYPNKLSPALTSYEMNGLEAGQEYVFAMAGENEVGIGQIGSALSVFTFDSGPTEPRSLKVVKISARMLTVSWEIPGTTNGEIRKYQIQYRRKDVNNTEMEVVDIFNPSQPTQSFTIYNLHPYYLYEVKVRAGNIQNGRNVWGSFSLTLVVRTKVEEPSASPTDLRALVLTSNTVVLRWKPLLKEDTNGPILAYIISYNTSDSHSEKRIQSDVETTNISKLSPWMNYSFKIKAENEAGVGPSSPLIFVRTYPQAPGASPINVRAAAMSSDTIQAAWQAPITSTWNSEIRGYKIQYRLSNHNEWFEKVTDNINIKTVLLKGLLPWMNYDIRVAAYTVQVVPGIGPYSPITISRTLQAASGPIGDVSYNSSVNRVELSWLPPSKPNGVILYYVLKYYSLNNTGLDVTSRRVNGTNYVLEDLQPNTRYNISIGSVNTAGLSPSSSYIISTIPQESVDDDAIPETTVTLLEGSTDPVYGDPGSDDKSMKNLPVIVGGSLTAGLFVLFIIILIIYQCIKKRRSERENYVISSHFKSKRLSSISEREESFNYTVNTQQIESPKPERQNTRYGSLTEQNETTTSQSPIQNTEIPGLVVTPPRSNTTPTSQLTRPESFHGSTNIPALENPNYLEDDVFAATLPRAYTTSSMTSEELYSKMGKKLKKNRMRSGSAAAIAVLRNSTLSISTNDTDSLVNNDSVVIYNERTVL